MVTPIEVLDTAIKIGLGALITGAATYVVAKLNHDKTADKERAQRRRAILESIAEQVGAFNRVALRHWALIANWLAYTPSTEQMSEEMYAELLKVRSELEDSYKELISAEAKLLLLGEVKCHKLLREYGTQVTVFREDVVTKRKITVTELDKYKKDLATKRESFFTELSNIYKSTD